MADLKQFANISATGIPNAPVQEFATDNSAAIEAQGTQTLVSSVGSVVVPGMQAADIAITNRNVRNLVGESADIPGMVDSPANLTGEEASFLNFQQIANARQSGLSADRARTAASTRLQQAIARDPRRADAYRAAYTNYFGGSGGSTFQLTQAEKAQEEMIDYGRTQFGIDSRLAYADPQAWERKFQDNMTLQRQQDEAERILTMAETGQKLDKMQQQSLFPQVVSGYLTNPESAVYIPNVIDSVMMPYRGEDGSFNANNAVRAEQELKIQLNSIEAQLRSNFSDMDSGDFESVFSPIEDYFENAIAVANGTMTEAALIRENRIFKEAAVQALHTENPEASRQWIGLTSLISELEVVPASMVETQNRLGRILAGSFSAIADPTNPVSAGDILSDTDYQDFGTLMTDVARAGARNPSPDSPTTERINSNLTILANELTSNPDRLGAGTYIEYFIATGRDGALDTMSPEQLQAVRNSYSSENVQTYLEDTLNEWEGAVSRIDGLNVQYSSDTHGLYVAVDPDAPDQTTLKVRARRIQNDLNRSNIFFRSAQKVVGTEGEDFLSSSEVGRGILAASGIEAIDTRPEGDFMRLPRGTPNRNRMAAISEEIIEGSATDDRVAFFNTVLERQPEFMRQNIPEINQALEVLQGRMADSSVAAQVQGQQARQTAARDQRLMQRLQGNNMSQRNAPGNQGVSMTMQPAPTANTTPTDVSPQDLDNVVLYGQDAVDKASEIIGRPLTPIEERLAVLEGYSDTTYQDSKDVATVGFGQTGEYSNMRFDEVVQEFVDKTKEMVPNYESLPEYLQIELVQAAYRGDLGISPKFRKLFNAGDYAAAALEFLDNEEYRTTDKRGIRDRMEAVSRAVQQYGLEVN